MSSTDDLMKKGIKSLSDKKLIDIVDSNSQNYYDEVIEIAKEEIKSRGGLQLIKEKNKYNKTKKIIIVGGM